MPIICLVLMSNWMTLNYGFTAELQQVCVRLLLPFFRLAQIRIARWRAAECDAFTNSDFLYSNHSGPPELICMWPNRNRNYVWRIFARRRRRQFTEHRAPHHRFDLKATVNERIDDNGEDGDGKCEQDVNLSNEFSRTFSRNACENGAKRAHINL